MALTGENYPGHPEPRCLCFNSGKYLPLSVYTGRTLKDLVFPVSGEFQRERIVLPFCLLLFFFLQALLIPKLS